jgi:hypothetical protein
MALPKPEPDPTIVIPAALYARVQELASAQDRTPEELVIFLIRQVLGELTPAERREELVRRSEEERRNNAPRSDNVGDPMEVIQRIGAELFPTEEDREFLLHFIESGVLDDVR